MAKKKTKKSEVNCRTKNLLAGGKYDPKDVKVRVSIVIDGEVLDAYKSAAQNTQHGDYQKLMKEKLRAAIFNKQVDPALREVIREIVREEIKWGV
jgi:uncharacterized protein (DUF4415 family)